MFVGCQALKHLDPVLGQIELLQLLQLLKPAQATDPVILRERLGKRMKVLEGREAQCLGQTPGLPSCVSCCCRDTTPIEITLKVETELCMTRP